MNILWAVLITLVIDWGLGTLIKYLVNNQLKRDEDVFTFKLEAILDNPEKSTHSHIEKALDLCRHTKGKLASGAYIVLSKLS